MKEKVTVFCIFFGCLISMTMSKQKTLYSSSRHDTWLDALGFCQNSSDNHSMASFDFYKSVPNKTREGILRQLNGSTAWLYGLEGISSVRHFRIGSMTPESELEVACADSHGYTKFLDEFSTYWEGNETCADEDDLTGGKMLSVENADTVIKLLDSTGFYGTTFWTRNVNESNLIHDIRPGGQVTVKCLLLDERGRLRSDSCFKKHKVVCTDDILKPTLKYVNASKIIDAYNLPTTTTTSTTPPSTVELTTGTSESVITTTGISQSPISSKGSTVTVATKMPKDNDIHEKEMQYIIIIGSVVTVMVVVAIALCCWLCRRKSGKPGADPKMSEVYSDAADSIVIRRVSGLGDKNTEYATPEDAVTTQKARARSSVTSNEYDVLSELPKHKDAKPKPKENINAYSHVQMTPAGGAVDEENAYDVTSHTRSKTSTLQSFDHLETYGPIGIKIT